MTSRNNKLDKYAGEHLRQSNLVLPTPEQMALAQARQQQAIAQQNNMVLLTRAKMAASVAGAVLTADGGDFTDIQYDQAVEVGFAIADACLARIGIEVQEKRQEPEKQPAALVE